MDKDQEKLFEELLQTEDKTLSFAKKLFFAQFDESKLTSLKEGELIDDYLKQIQAFAEETIDADTIDRNKEIPDQVIDGLKKLKVLGMTVPKEFGGLGMSFHSYCKVTELLAGYCGSTTLFLNVHQSIGIQALLLYGTKQQKQKWLPDLASGEKIAAFALTEPNAGSDASALEATATYDPEKKIYRISGIKQWITNGSIASVLTVMARTDKGITAFLVTPDMPGFFVKEAALDKVGFRGTKTAVLEFKEMEVPEENILGDEGRGLNVALSVLNFGRTTFGALCNGVGKYLMKRAFDHAAMRHQFNQPLNAFPMVKRMLASIASKSYAIDAMTYQVAHLIDRGEGDVMLETAILKVYASESLWSMIYDTMQIFGGRSFFTDEPFERLMRDARLNMIGEGANEVMRVFIATVGLRELGLYLQKGVGKLPEIVQLFKQEARSLVSLPKVSFQNAHLEEEILTLRKRMRSFSYLSKYLLIKHRKKVVDQQLDLNRVTDALIAIFTTLCVLKKAERVSDQKELATAKFTCQKSLRFAKERLSLIGDSFDEKIDELLRSL